VLAGVAPASADDRVPGDDIFGFTAPTDIGEVGEEGYAIETTHRLGKGRGRFDAMSTKYEFSRTVDPSLWIAVSPFTRNQTARNAPGIGDVDCRCFDGFSSEVMYLLVPRSDHQPIAAALSFEPNWSRVDAMTAAKAHSLSAEIKLFVDAPIAKDWFWGLNLNYDPSVVQAPSPGKWARTATSNISTAVSHEIAAGVFVGAEIRYQQAFGSYGLRHALGRAVFIGPTAAFEIADEVVVSATWQPQVAGHARHDRYPVDVINFEQTNYRFRISYTPGPNKPEQDHNTADDLYDRAMKRHHS
jgi:hypothetical protein